MAIETGVVLGGVALAAGGGALIYVLTKKAAPVPAPAAKAPAATTTATRPAQPGGPDVGQVIDIAKQAIPFITDIWGQLTSGSPFGA